MLAHQGDEITRANLWVEIGFDHNRRDLVASGHTVKLLHNQIVRVGGSKIRQGAQELWSAADTETA